MVSTTDSDRSTTTAVWDPLWGSIPMMNMSCSLASWLGSPRRAHLMRVDAVPLTSHTATGPDRTAGSFRSQPHGGTAFERHTRPGPRRYERPSRPADDAPSGPYALIGCRHSVVSLGALFISPRARSKRYVH